jgi:2-oxoglutarate ferredoxin oxidoreductase subunit beta
MRTTTTPEGRDPNTTGVPFHGAELAASIETVAYSARCSTHTPKAFREAKKAVRQAFQKQVDGVGYGFVEMISICPTNWKLRPNDCLDFVENVMLAEFPLGEFKNVDKIDYYERRR